MKQKLNIFTPVYYDVPSFTILRDKIQEQFKDGIYEIKFHVIDDTAGEDSEMEQVKTWDDCTVITPPFNLGHQRALVYALRKSVGVLAMMKLSLP